uniref:Uncharacterized aminotransferase C660.12c-like n=1 Tax=Saccoglossus kowalevskii TaxID=10224 RepID=A0ABM0N1H3_SACKO
MLFQADLENAAEAASFKPPQLAFNLLVGSPCLWSIAKDGSDVGLGPGLEILGLPNIPQFLKEAESRPDEFMKLKSPIYYEEALLSIAEFVGANIENMVFVENTTTGINTVLKAMKFKKGESILINNLTHEAVSNTVVDVCDNPDLETTVVKLEIKLPIRSKEEIIQQYSDVLEDNPSVKVAVVDHITSSSAMVMPIKELIEVCKSKDVQVVIDGAQAIGQLQFNLGELGADYYIGNLHKWMFGVRGSAILWIHPKHYKSIKPLITGHNYQQSLFNQFFNQGTRDSSAYFCAPAAIKFFEEIGGF